MLLLALIRLCASDPMEQLIDEHMREKDETLLTKSFPKYLTVHNPHADCHYNDYKAGLKPFFRSTIIPIIKTAYDGNTQIGDHVHYNYAVNVQTGKRVLNPAGMCLGHRPDPECHPITNHELPPDAESELYNLKYILHGQKPWSRNKKFDMAKVFNDEFSDSDMEEPESDDDSDDSSIWNNYKHIFAFKDINRGKVDYDKTYTDVLAGGKIPGRAAEIDKALETRNATHVHGLDRAAMSRAHDDMVAPIYRRRVTGTVGNDADNGMPNIHNYPSDYEVMPDASTEDMYVHDTEEENAFHKGYGLPPNVRSRRAEAEQFGTACAREVNCRNRVKAVHDEDFYDIHYYPEKADTLRGPFGAPPSYKSRPD